MINGIKCPLCGGEILERKKSFSCSNWKDEDGGCHFTIWKVNFGATFSEDDIIRLFQGETLRKVNVSKAGNEYLADWTLDPTPDGYGAKYTYVPTPEA